MFSYICKPPHSLRINEDVGGETGGTGEDRRGSNKVLVGLGMLPRGRGGREGGGEGRRGEEEGEGEGRWN